MPRRCCIEPEPIEEGLDVLIDSGDVAFSPIAGVEACYLAELYAAESYTAERLGRMAQTQLTVPVDFSDILANLEREQGITYAPLQRKTLEIAAEHQVMVITGGPGTGKTTTVRALLSMFTRMGLDVKLAAPTGRAAKRLSELSGREALTIHRLLEAGYAPDSQALVFKRDETNPLECGAMIVDECSMIDITLMKVLLCALPKDCRLVLVGDADQLPSVGPGNVFMDILRSHAIPAVRLTEIFRQTADSRIVRYAHAINAGAHPDIADNKGDFFFMRRTSADAARELVVQLCAERLPKNMGIPSTEIQVLTPMRKGELGVERLNEVLQHYLNPASPKKNEKKIGSRIFREGDKVMQIRNDYQAEWEVTGRYGIAVESGQGIFNGDIGIVKEINFFAEQLTVEFDGARQVRYPFSKTEDLEHAFAVTIHKSQGSEYPAVILPLLTGPRMLMNRNLLYTAVTRAKKCVVIVGSQETVQTMIDNERQQKRYTTLDTFIRETAAVDVIRPEY